MSTGEVFAHSALRKDLVSARSAPPDCRLAYNPILGREVDLNGLRARLLQAGGFVLSH